MAYDLHVFIGQDGEPHASMTMADGHRTSTRKLSRKYRVMLIELRNELELYDRRKQLKHERRARKAGVSHG